MSLSDCIHCWCTPCRCGFEYKDWTLDAKIDLAASVLDVDKDKLTDMLRRSELIKKSDYTED